MPVVIVESPAKAKTINKYLGPAYEVIASYGHVRDLPAKDGSVEPETDFTMLWEIDGKASKRLNEIAKAVRGTDKLILATDPDREGEAISWHVLEILREKRALKDVPVERVTFNAITKDAVQAAMRKPRQIDGALVDAYLARRALDYLVGFRLSPVLWRKLPGSRSAGRVQSVALRLVCDRESEIERFVAREYWSLVASLATPRGDIFEARLVGADGKRIQRLDVGTAAEAAAFRDALEAARFAVASVEAKPAKRHPFAAVHDLDAATGGEPQARLSPRTAPCNWLSASMRAWRSAARRSASSPICGPTASTWRRKRSRPFAPDREDPGRSAICPAPRGAIRPRRRTRRRRMRRSVRQIRSGCRRMSRAISTASKPASTS